MQLLQNRTVVMVLGGLVIAGVIWYSFMRDRSTDLLATQDLTTATETDADIVSTLLALRSVSLSGTIFTDPAFLQLTDFGSAIVPEPVGRPNPFAPMTGSAPAAAAAPTISTATTTSTTTRSAR